MRGWITGAQVDKCTFGNDQDRDYGWVIGSHWGHVARGIGQLAFRKPQLDSRHSLEKA